MEFLPYRRLGFFFNFNKFIQKNMIFMTFIHAKFLIVYFFE